MPLSIQLHSSLPLETAAGWNFHAADPRLTLRCNGLNKPAILSSKAGIEQTWPDPLDALQWMADCKLSPHSRWVGYLSYDLGRLFEPLANLAVDDLETPLFCFFLMEPEKGEPEKGTGTISEEPEKGTGTISALSNAMAADKMGTVPISSPVPISSLPLISTLPKPEFLNRVSRAIDYIRAGDIFQMNLSQRFTAPLALDPQSIWNNLITAAPAAYGAYLDCGDHVICSNSPELFLRVTPERRVATRPIKGTRPRGTGMYDDLLHSSKDQAELNMIVDLERNDLGRVCAIGSVRVSQPRTIETHPTVYHGVATIEGQLKVDVTFIDLLRATFPGGSIIGAPKIRAMQIIEELEPVRRGVYCGAIGYLAADGSMQFNVAIRTMTIKDGRVYIPVGGGIVADSVPSDEYDETITKASAMLRALEIKR